MARKLYTSCRDSRFAVIHDGHAVVSRHVSMKEATIAAKQWRTRAEYGFALRGTYEAISLTDSQYARPFKLYVSGNGY
jgi:hypothetical protein